MKFARPLPYKEAVKVAQSRVLLPTTLTSAQLAEIEGDTLAKARFSARVRSIKHLAVLDDGVNDLVAGQLDMATARLKVKNFLKSVGYIPPEDKRGGLEDFSSDRRIDLQLRMNVQADQAYGYELQGQDADLLDAFPARELVRVESREQERPDWPQRWNEARRATITDGATDSGSGRMVALVGHPIWRALSVFDRETEPYDYGSGMGREDVDRADAMDLGLLGRDTQIFPTLAPMRANLSAPLDVRSANLRALAEESGVGRFNKQGVFVYAGGRP